MLKVKNILNIPERSLNDKILKVIGSERHVLPSVSSAVAFNINRNDLTLEEFDLALKTSFDFIITDSTYFPLLAIEFDGPVHNRVSKQLIDKTKNQICEKANLPLLRIDNALLDAKIGNFKMVEWLVELHFIYEEYCKMQEQGKIPLDEPFYYGNILKFDPFIESRANIQKYWKKGYIKNPVPYCFITEPGDNYYYSFAAIEYCDDKWFYGEASCRISLFPAMPPSELAEELSVVTLEENLLKRSRNMDIDTMTTEEILLKRMKQKIYRETGMFDFKK